MALHTLHNPHNADECCKRARPDDVVIVMDEAVWALAAIAANAWACPLYVYADDLAITGNGMARGVPVATVDEWAQLTVAHPQHIAW
jgi:hypothetical protein